MARWGMLVISGLIAVGVGFSPGKVEGQTAGQIGYVNTTTVLQQTPGYGAVDSTLGLNAQDSSKRPKHSRPSSIPRWQPSTSNSWY